MDIYGHIFKPAGRVHGAPPFWYTFSHVGAKMLAKMEANTKSKLESQKGGAEGSKIVVGATRRDLRMRLRAKKRSKYGSEGCQNEAPGGPNMPR